MLRRCAGMFVALGLAAAQDPVAPPAPPAAAAEPSQTMAARATRRAACDDTKVLTAVRRGLEWLRQHQDADGRWDCDGFGKHDGDEKVAGTGDAQRDIGITALALLALLAEGDPLHRDAIERGVDWLVRQQKPDGMLGPPTADAIYDHALSTHALVEAVELLPRERWRAAAATALACMLARRNPGAAWRYGVADGDNDASITSWCVAALAAGAAAGFAVPPEAVGEALAWVDSVTDSFQRRVGYTKAGETSARRTGKHISRFPPEHGEAITAGALHARLVVGLEPSHPLLDAGAKLVLGKLPSAADASAIDFYYWYHGSQAMAQLPKATSGPWFRALDAALLALQCRDGAAMGSWDPSDVWGEDGGRVYSTAIAVLALQSRYRVADDALVRALPRTGQLSALRDKFLRGDRAAAFELSERCERTATVDAERRALEPIRWSFAVEQAAIRRRIAPRSDPGADDWWGLFEALERARRVFRGTPLAAEAERRLQEVQKLPSGQRELAAGKRLQTLRQRHDPPRGDARALIEQLEKLIVDYPSTQAADHARSWLSVLRDNR